MPSIVLRIAALVAICLVPGGAFLLGLWGVNVYAVRQGAFDGDVVRFARAMSLNDERIVDLARALVADKAKAWTLPEIEGEFGSGPDRVPTPVAVAVLIGHRGLRHVAAFDWKDDEVPVSLDRMLDAYGAPPPPKEVGDRIEAEVDAVARFYGAPPIAIAHYDRFFRAAGLALMHINTGSDSYILVALPSAMAEKWDGVRLPDEPLTRSFSGIDIEPAVAQAERYIRERMPEPKAELPSPRRAERPVPASAGLPLRIVFRLR